MEGDNSLCEKILSDLEKIIKCDSRLKEFSIVPITQTKNKSPVLYEEHNLGLESWCINHVYKYAYSELFKERKSVKQHRLPICKVEKIERLLTGVLLIHPDVTTFWNMRRELVEYKVIDVGQELLFTKLVLTNKSKSNEAFAYRKWILRRLLQDVDIEDRIRRLILEDEFFITEIAAGKAQNNYHAWSHRIWCLQNIAPLSNSYIILNQLDFSLKWVSTHVSEHAGFHYRQFLYHYIKSNTDEVAAYSTYYSHVEKHIGIPNTAEFNPTHFLTTLLGEREYDVKEKLLECMNYMNYFCVLLFDLFYTVEKLNSIYPGHESIWCFRRSIIYNLLQTAYEYHNIKWKPNVSISDALIISNKSLNITQANLSNKVKSKCQENGEKHPKLLKCEPDKVESSYLYNILLKTESNYIKDGVSGGFNSIQLELAHKHERWLRHILCLNEI